MKRRYGQIKTIVVLAITFDLRLVHISVTQTLLYGSSLTYEILIHVLWGNGFCNQIILKDV